MSSDYEKRELERMLELRTKALESRVQDCKKYLAIMERLASNLELLYRVLGTSRSEYYVCRGCYKTKPRDQILIPGIDLEHEKEPLCFSCADSMGLHAKPDPGFMEMTRQACELARRKRPGLTDE